MKSFTSLLFILLSLQFGYRLHADPVDCLSEDLIDRYADHIASFPYLIENCYYCEPEVYRLIRIDRIEKTECNYDPSQFMLEAAGEVIAQFSDPACNTIRDAHPAEIAFSGQIILNYAYGFNGSNREAQLLVNIFSSYEWANCNWMDFPDPNENRIGNEAYATWYEKTLNMTDSGPFIARFQGTINNKYPISMKLRMDDFGDLAGEYMYDKVGKPISLSGHLTETPGFEIREFVGEENTGKFKGLQFNKQRLSGTWESADGTKSFPFEVNRVEEPDNPWSGIRHRNGRYSGGQLVIGNVTETSFDFMLDFDVNCHLGTAGGTARINGKRAEFHERMYEEADHECGIVFELKDSGIQITGEGSSLDCGYGMRAYPDGLYEVEPEETGGTMYEVFENYSRSTNSGLNPGRLTENFEKMVRDIDLIEAFGYLLSYEYQDDCPNLDPFNAGVICVFVPGCGISGILMIREDGIMYAGMNQEYYFSNDPANPVQDIEDLSEAERVRVPQTLRDWFGW